MNSFDRGAKLKIAAFTIVMGLIVVVSWLQIQQPFQRLATDTDTSAFQQAAVYLQKGFDQATQNTDSINPSDINASMNESLPVNNDYEYDYWLEAPRPE